MQRGVKIADLNSRYYTRSLGNRYRLINLELNIGWSCVAQIMHDRPSTDDSHLEYVQQSSLCGNVCTTNYCTFFGLILLFTRRMLSCIGRKTGS